MARDVQLNALPNTRRAGADQIYVGEPREESPRRQNTPDSSHDVEVRIRDCRTASHIQMRRMPAPLSGLTRSIPPKETKGTNAGGLT